MLWIRNIFHSNKRKYIFKERKEVIHFFSFSINDIIITIKSNGELNIGISAWVWTFSILYFYRRSEKKCMKWLAFILTILISAIKWYGMVDGNFYVKFICGIILGVCFFIPYLIDCCFYKKVDGFKATLIFPLSFATIEFFISTMPMGELESLAETQTDYTSLIQLAAFIGTYGISVMVSWLASTIIYIADYVRDNKKIPHKAAFTYLSVLIIVLFIGGLRVAAPLKDVKTIKVAVSTGIENGFTIVRSTYDGYSAIFDPYGQVYGLSHTDYSGYENVIIYETPVKSRFTIYKYIGPIIDWLYPISLVLLLISPKVKLKKK